MSVSPPAVSGPYTALYLHVRYSKCVYMTYGMKLNVTSICIHWAVLKHEQIHCTYYVVYQNTEYIVPHNERPQVR
jgi:hypothetical protein